MLITISFLCATAQQEYPDNAKFEDGVLLICIPTWY